MHVSTYLAHMQGADRNRSLMARIILNTMVDASAFPVDISELRLLSPLNRALTCAVQEWAYSHPFFRFDDETLKALCGWAALADRTNQIHARDLAAATIARSGLLPRQE